MSETTTDTPPDMEQPDPELQFPPRAGGMVETARKMAARHQAAYETQAQAEAKRAAAAPRPARPVTVKNRQPDEWGARTLTIAVGASAMAMPADPDRRRGKINLLSASPASVLIAKDRSAADSGTGYTLMGGQPPEEIGHTREVWLNNPSAASITVSVYTETYTRE